MRSPSSPSYWRSRSCWCSPLNDARPAGESGPLELLVRRKAYKAASGARLEVLRDISLSLRQGEVAALVGPSGCGKTTMLRIIAGLDRDYEGTLRRPASGRLGMVFQEPRLLPWRSVDDNELVTLFDVLELGLHRTHYPGELSLGLARRVALARAFAVSPELLLLDEPFVSLDEALAARLRDALAKLVDRRAVTTLLVTHDIDEAVGLADRILLLSARPAHVLAEVPILTPRRARTGDDLASVKATIASRLAA